MPIHINATQHGDILEKVPALPFQHDFGSKEYANLIQTASKFRT